ncbi:MAG: cytochrome-c oxidase, cbb3-type subunit III [Acidimicrobiales bacterium]|nr:cytochrome-c oxidase, cbb3-type subunit III [Hyphomonadaceae bacterium]RZV43951.1 MAG: cytochrome-c oxidase, cbb3-type subunit III [Acidimicrobiales bacterium]
MSEKRIDEQSGTEVTGHEWDGIEELNTPMPRWWLWIFYASIVFAIIYAILMPALPGIDSYSKGVLGKSDRVEVVEELYKLTDQRAVYANKMLSADIETIEGDEDLLRYALAAGESAFGDNCATCHGTNGQGLPGYPNLNDDIWLWGGSYEDIRQTLNYGIRALHEDTRVSLMQAYGRDELLTREEISDLTEYVVSLSGREADASAIARVSTLYQEQCASCHGMDGKGDRLQGAPDLSDNEWLYGGDRATIVETLTNGRAGVMPHWKERLSPDMVNSLAYYVHSLGGGEKSDAPTQ